MELGEKLKGLKVLFRPAGLDLNHGLQGFATESCATTMKGNCNSAAIHMVLNLVRSMSPVKTEPVTDKRKNDFTGSKIPYVWVIDAHRSDRDRDARLNRDLHLIGRLLRNVFTMFKHALHDHPHDVVDILESLGLRGAPG